MRHTIVTLTGRRYPKIPCLSGTLLLGRLPYLFQDNGVLNNLFAAGELATSHLSGMCYYRIINKFVLLITKPEDIYQFKVKNEHCQSSDLQLSRAFTGPNIFIDEKQQWKQKRDAYHDAIYTHTALIKLEPEMKKIIDSYISQIELQKETPINFRILSSNLVCDVLTKTVMGCTIQPPKLDSLSETAQYLLDLTHDIFEFRQVFKWMLPAFLRKLFFPKELNDFDKLKVKMQSRYDELILNSNEENIWNTDNLLKKLWEININKKTANKCPHHADILGDGIMLLTAGVVTTVAVLEFIIKLLCANPDKEYILRRELKQHLQNQPLTMQALENVEYLDMVIKEALRLYPPLPIFLPREMTDPCKINGVHLCKGDTVIVSPYITHRLTYIWDKPNDFIPERFTEENERNIPKHAYIPFGIGPRFCIGQQFSLQEMKLLLATLYLRYQIKLESNDFAITLQQGGLASKEAPIAYFSS